VPENQLQTLDAYTQLMTTNAAVHAFRSAVDLGVIEALLAGPRTVAELAVSEGLQAGPLELLLDSLCALGVLERYEDHFAAAPVLHVLPAPLRDLGDRYWRHLSEFVRTGKRIPEADADGLGEADFSIEAAASQWLMTPAALSAAQALDVGGTRNELQVLELACCSAVWSLSLAHRDPQLRAVLVDRPERLRAARENAEGIGLADRVEFIESDYLQVDFEAPRFDLVLLPNVMHRHSLADNRRLLQRVHRWLNPEGEVAIIDVFPGQEAGDRMRQFFRLSVALRTSEGGVHGPEELRALLLDAGFSSPQYTHLPVPPHTMGLMIASR
jgi:SAM-dependent methyltransferase